MAGNNDYLSPNANTGIGYNSDDGGSVSSYAGSVGPGSEVGSISGYFSYTDMGENPLSNDDANMSTTDVDNDAIIIEEKEVRIWFNNKEATFFTLLDRGFKTLAEVRAKFKECLILAIGQYREENEDTEQFPDELTITHFIDYGRTLESDVQPRACGSILDLKVLEELPENVVKGVTKQLKIFIAEKLYKHEE